MPVWMSLQHLTRFRMYVRSGPGVWNVQIFPHENILESAGQPPLQECSRHQQGIQTVWDCLGMEYADCSRPMRLCYLLCNCVEALNALSVRIINSVAQTLNLDIACRTDAWPFCEMAMLF